MSTNKVSATQRYLHPPQFVALLIGILLWIVGGQRAYAATTIYVTPAGGGDGSSWANATTLQNALSTATTGDEIWVKSGLYLPGISASDTFALKAGVAVYGGFAGSETLRSERDWQTHLTVLSGDIDNNDVAKDASGVITTTANLRGTNSEHIVFANAEGYQGHTPTNNPPITSATRLDGFIITSGNSPNRGGGFFCDGQSGGLCNPHLENIIFSGNKATSEGGAIFNYAWQGESSPSLVNVTFTGNSAADGGAIFNEGDRGIMDYSTPFEKGVSSPSLVNVTFTGNSANRGGAIYNHAAGGKSNPTLDNVTFTGNWADNGGAMYNHSTTNVFGLGGESNPQLNNVTFTSNWANKGGAIFSYSQYSSGTVNSTNANLVNVTFAKNSASDGGAMYNYVSGLHNTSSPRLLNVLFAGNLASNDGGAMYNWGQDQGDSNPALDGVTFFGNVAGRNGGAMYNQGHFGLHTIRPILTNVILWGNRSSSGPSTIVNIYAQVVATNSLFEGTISGPCCITDGGGNISSNPNFENAPAGNFQLSFGSPAIDSGTNPASPLATDLAGNPRVIDSDSSGTATIDMGAYEAPVYNSNSAFALTVVTTGNGSAQVDRAPVGAICASVCTARYLPGTVVTLTPNPNPGSSFAGWSGICTGMGTCVVTMNSAQSVTASFTEDAYTLSLYGVGVGEIARLPDSPNYTYGEEVTLYAYADNDYTFTGWSGDCTGTDDCKLTMDGDKSVTATFLENPYVLTLNKSAGGSVDKFPNRLKYAEGESVDLYPYADEGYYFAGWSGDCTGTDDCNVTMDGDKSVTATFLENPYVLTVNTSAGGSVDKFPDQDRYAPGEEVALIANTNAGYTFTGWSGACTGTGDCTVTMNGNKSVTATFTPPASNTYALTVNKVGSGAVTKNPNQATYAAGTIVNLTTTADSGFTFTGWSGACTGTGACVVTMDTVKSVTATFTQNAYVLTVNKAGNGTVTKNPDQATYNHGTTVNLTVAADAGWTFTGWGGACTGTGACAVTMDATKSVTAIFTKNDTPGNDEPTFTSIPVLNLPVATAYTYAIVVVDPDAGDTLTLSAPTKPTWLTLTPTGNGTATLSGTPGASNVGINPVQLRVQDAAGLFAIQNFDIFVAADPATTGVVKGRVVDGNGNGVPGALVTLTDASRAVTIATLLTQITDSNGDYRFDGVPLGNYTLAVSIDGKEPSEPVDVAVQVGQTATIPAIALTEADPAPALEVSMFASQGQATVGDTITYTYHITNTGNVTLTTISATDTQLEAVTALAGQLLPNASRSATLTYVVQPSDLPGPFINTVTVTGTDPFGTEVSESAMVNVNLQTEGEQPSQIFLPKLDR